MSEHLTFGSIATLALTSSLFSTALGQGVTWYRERRVTMRETSYLAVRIATVFERYARETTDRVSDNDEWIASEHASGNWSTQVPTLGQLPDEKERWRDLDVRLTTRVLDFTPHRDVVQLKIDDAYDKLDGEDATAILRAETLRLGARAFSLGEDLRKGYSIPRLGDAYWQTYLSDEVNALANDDNG
ncbi:hypothetical protein [Sphingomonas sp. CARO-RG-8B-R24-01]|uniref:hypothetical protein n=1 Tax=Sphingomonas sp. CARO-RG-8B-R24-01 TaxID=2914831 RepID=UPI001F599A49|nr:hypothetical protein [Sphingomonas sp. CARO-RG-8B-R24-01]